MQVHASASLTLLDLDEKFRSFILKHLTIIMNSLKIIFRICKIFEKRNKKESL